MSKFDDIKMPDNIDEVTKNAIRRGKTKKYQYKKVTNCLLYTSDAADEL